MFADNPIIQVICTGWRFADKHRKLIPIYLVLFACAQAIQLTEPFLIGQLVNSVQQGVNEHLKSPPATLHAIFLYLALYLAAKVAFWFFHTPGRLIETFVAFQIRANYKGHLFQILTQSPLQWHRIHHSGESIDKINRASVALFNFFESTCESCYMLFRLVGAVIILFCFMPTVGITAGLTAFIAFSVIFLFDRVLIGKYSWINKCENAVASALHDYVSNIISIITLRVEPRVLADVKKRMTVALPIYKRSRVLNEWKWCLTNVIIGIMIFGAMSYYAHSTILSGKSLLAGTFFTLFEYLRRIGDSSYNFAMICGTVVQRAADVETARSILDNEKTVSVAGSMHTLPPDWQVVQVRDLNFVYKDEQQRTHHLDHVSIELRRTWKIAFVGESGSGKSTLLNLLRGTLHSDDVRVYCDDRILEHGLFHVASCTTLMPQSPEIFADTIRFNITFGVEAEEQQIMEAVRLARFETVLSRLPDGLETNIAERGVNLSCGESQRLALARGIFFGKDSDIVLLDEPTSSVDPDNERQIYQNMLETFSNKCVISSVHKLHLLDLFDMIYVFSDGGLVEKGSLNCFGDENPLGNTRLGATVPDTGAISRALPSLL